MLWIWLGSKLFAKVSILKLDNRFKKILLAESSQGPEKYFLDAKIQTRTILWVLNVGCAKL